MYECDMKRQELSRMEPQNNFECNGNGGPGGPPPMHNMDGPGGRPPIDEKMMF
jgi:hypothetical protein